MSRMPVCEPSQESSDDLKTRPKHEENDLCHYTAGEAENPEHNPLCDEREERNWFRSWLRESEDTSAWWLLFFVFLFNTLAGMFASMFGILLVEYSIHFDASIAVLAVIPALQMAAIAIGGIIMSGPVDRYGCSRVAFAGAVITFLGMSTASLGNTVPFLYITQGLVAGFGFSISQLCGPVIVQQHFTRNRPLACGLAYLGYSLGMCNSIESVIMLEVAGLDNLSRSIGISNLVFGVSSMIASPICGLLYDVTGSYDIPFAVTGCAAGLSSIAVAYIHCLRPKDQLKAGNMSNTVGLERNTDKALNGSWNSLPL